MQGGGGVRAGGRSSSRLTTQSTCEQGSWASLWGNGRPGQTPRTGTRCPAPWVGGETHKCGAQHPQLSLPTSTCSQPRHKEGCSPGSPVGVPVVLRGMLVSQHLQVDGLRPPFDAPVLGRGQVCKGGEWG